jgi:hypothetical protein
MKNLNTMTLLAAGTCAMIAASAANAGVVSLTGNSYSQDFQSFGTGSVTNAVVPVTTMTEASTLTGGGTVNGWYVYGQGYTTSNTKWFPQDTGTNNSGGFRSMYSAASGSTAANYALGAQGSTSAKPLNYGTVIKNDTGADITGATISFDAFMNRNPSSNVNTTSFSYLISSTAVAATSGTGAGTFHNSAGTWTSVADLAFSTPSTGTGAPGTQAAINPMLSLGSKSAALSGFTWASGSYIYLRWTDLDETGSDATMGVDNFTISVPAPGAIALLGVAGLVGSRRRR